LGVTTYSVLDMLDDVLFKQNFKAVLISHDQKSMEEIFYKVQIAWREFPQEIKDYIGWLPDTENKNQLRFNNGSSISITTSARSGTVNRVHISEFGKICAKYPEKANEILTGTFPAVVPGGRIDIESTAEGNFGAYHDMFMEAFDNGEPKSQMDFKAFFFPWTMDEAYVATVAETGGLPKDILAYQELYKLTDEQAAFYFLTKKVLKEKIKQEYPTVPEEAFEASGSMIFDQDNLNIRLQNDVREPEINGDWHVFHNFIPTHRYGMGADVSEGIGRDACTAVIFDFSAKVGNTTVPKVVARYMNKHIDPTTFAFELSQMGAQYGGCIIAVERNNHGHATLAKLKELYHNIYVEHKTDKWTNQPTEKLGWHTTAASKPQLLMDFKFAVENDEITICDRSILFELKKYGSLDLRQIKYDEKLSNHFDLVMAIAIAYEMRDHATGGGKITLIEEPLAATRIIQ